MEPGCKPNRSEPTAACWVLTGPAGSARHKPAYSARGSEGGELQGRSWWKIHLRRYNHFIFSSNSQVSLWKMFHLFNKFNIFIKMLSEVSKKQHYRRTCCKFQQHGDRRRRGLKWRLIHHVEPHFTWSVGGGATSHRHPADICAWENQSNKNINRNSTSTEAENSLPYFPPVFLW